MKFPASEGKNTNGSLFTENKLPNTLQFNLFPFSIHGTKIKPNPGSGTFSLPLKQLMYLDCTLYWEFLNNYYVTQKGQKIPIFSLPKNRLYD